MQSNSRGTILQKFDQTRKWLGAALDNTVSHFYQCYLQPQRFHQVERRALFVHNDRKQLND